MNLGNGATQRDSVTSITPINGASEDLSRNLSNLEEALTHLFQRLKPIRNEKQLAGQPESNKPPMPMKSSLTSQIEHFAMRVNAMKQATEIVLSEIEL